jgi:hypothetical protein
MKKLIAALSLALLVSVVLAASATGAPGTGGGNNDSASGTVNFGSGYDTFSAKSSAIGTDAQGSWKRTITTADPNTIITGDIRCLRVAGDTFEARGVIVDVRPSTSGTSFPQGFILRGSDSGKFSTAPDTYSQFFTPTPQLEDSCLVPTPGSIVQNGEIVVKDAF